jgi:hypothetical protein
VVTSVFTCLPQNETLNMRQQHRASAWSMTFDNDILVSRNNYA